MASVALHGKETARCGQQEGDEKEVLALTVAWTQGGHRQVTGESRVALELPWRLTPWEVIWMAGCPRSREWVARVPPG